MRRIVVAVMSTISGLVLLFSYHTSTGGGTVVASGGPASGGSRSGGSSTSSSGGSGTYTGDAVQTRWGPVQVAITVENGRITKSDAVVYPQENGRDVEINNSALPILAQEVVDAQSAQIDAVSGATVTSDGYVQSLQSALDQAKL
jgi:uncharacterized protein with FMN-binding domain